MISESKEIILKKNRLFYNGKIYIQAGDYMLADSMAVSGNRIVAVGKKLERDEAFDSFEKLNLRGRTVIPGFTDSHTHFYFYALSLGSVKLDGLADLDAALAAVKKHAAKLGRDEWVFGEGFSPDRWKKYILPDKFMLDKVTGGRPAAIYSKDQHMLWVNSRALELAGLGRKTHDPDGGKIDRLENNEPSGILRELPGYVPIIRLIPDPPPARQQKYFRQALATAYAKGVTGVHSFDGIEALDFFDNLSRNKKLGLRINYYPPAANIPALRKAKIKFGYGNDYFRINGVKIFSDGSLGSQTALCFNKYPGPDNQCGVETNTKEQMLKWINAAARLYLPTAIHAIGDRAISNVLDCYEQAPPLPIGARRRIEHLQMIRRSDIKRLKALGVVASMQPTHCPSDITLIEKYWGKRGRNCYIFNTLLKKGIPLTFGSDLPIEALDPIAGIDAAVNRRAVGIKKTFYPEERISIAQAVYGFTAGPAYTVGQEHERGYLLPGYFADFVILSNNIFKMARTRIKDVEIVATFFDGKPVYRKKGLSLPF